MIVSNNSPIMESSIKAKRRYATPEAMDPPVCATRLSMSANDIWKSGMTRMAHLQIDYKHT